MSVSSYDAVAEKVLLDLELAIKKNPNINEFYIIPISEEENKNSSPISKRENTLGLESWIVTHIYPYAYHQMLQKTNYKSQNISKLIACLTGVALLNPDMPIVWNRRRELILSKQLSGDDELRLTNMTLSRKPKCNEALLYRKWVIKEILKDVQDKSRLLIEELRLSEMIANRYHSNFHAWSHRMWSLQNLILNSPFQTGKKKPQKTGFYEKISIELCEVVTRGIDRNEYLYLRKSDMSRLYFEELENNFKWISSHVSDHSGLHFRKFLISEIFLFIKNYLSKSKKAENQTEVDYHYSNSQYNLVSSFFANSLINLREFLNGFNYGANFKKTIDDYLINLEREVTLFDLMLALVVTELKSNISLCLIFSTHEALWYYRRFLIFLYKQLIEILDFSKNNSERKSGLHQDSSGVPHRKDFKLDDLESDKTVLKHSELYLALYSRLITNEKEVISKTNSQDETLKLLLKNYSHWLKYCFKE